MKNLVCYVCGLVTALCVKKLTGWKRVVAVIGIFLFMCISVVVLTLLSIVGVGSDVINAIADMF